MFIYKIKERLLTLTKLLIKLHQACGQFFIYLKK